MQACSLSLEPKCVDVTVIFGRILHTYPNRGTLAPWITTFVLQTGRTSCRICRGRKWAEERWWILTEHDESISSTYLAVLAIMLRAARRFSLLFAPVPTFFIGVCKKYRKVCTSVRSQRFGEDNEMSEGNGFILVNQNPPPSPGHQLTFDRGR